MDSHQMAAALERVLIDSGYFDLSVLTPGSPAYMRRLRDEHAARLVEVWSEGQVYPDPGKLPELAIIQANALIAALGYPVPGEEADNA